jgi:hypothetical protein
MATYTPVNKTYTIWNKDPANSVDITDFVFADNANIQHHITFSSDWSAGAGADWAPGVDYTGNSTLISKTKTYVGNVGNVYVATAATNYFKGHSPFTRNYTTSTGTSLQVSSTATVAVGMAITGGGFTGQTVTAFSATSGWMVLNAVSPSSKPSVGTPLTFTDPYPPTLKLVSTASLYTGMIMNGNGFTAGQTVVSIGTDSTVVASADPNTGVYANALVEFQPPQYVLKVNNIVGLSAGWYADTNTGYVYTQPRTILSTSGTQYLIMSGDVGYPSPSGDVRFISNVNKMITLAPNTSATWVLYYDANNSAVSNNLASITIYATQQGNTVQKIVNNIVSINQAPGVSNIQPPAAPGGGNHSGAGYTVDVNTVTFYSDLNDGYDVPSTLTTVTVTDQNGNIVSVTITSTDAISFSNVPAATDGVAQAAAAIGTDAATAASVAAAVAAADAAATAAADAAAAAASDAAAAAAADGTSTSTGTDGTSTSTGTDGGTTSAPASTGGDGGDGGGGP